MKVTIGKVTLLMYFLLKLQHSIKRKREKNKPVDNQESGETQTALGGSDNDRDPSQNGSNLP